MFSVPCFPSSRAKVVEPQDTVQYKNVHRYGETNIKHVGRPMRQDQWKKSQIDPNAGRQLPEPPHHTDEDAPRQLRKARKPTQHQMEREHLSSSMPRQQAPPAPTSKQPLTSDFYISVPIFNETLDHSYRKKNEYVHVDSADDTSSVFHQSLSRASSLRELNTDRRPPAGLNQSLERRQTKTRQRAPGSLKQHRPTSGSEASYNTYSSRATTHSYESERFDPAKVLRKAPSKSRGHSIVINDSDEEDSR